MPPAPDPEPTGLTSAAAGRLLAEHGPNELPSARPVSLFAIAFEVVREPMLLLLLASGVVYLLLGDRLEAIALLASIAFVIGITLTQQVRSTRALEALRALSSPQAWVVRDGERRRVPGREVVPGDVLVVHEGERVAADARLVATLNLSVDESILTGESVPVEKTAGDDRILSGTLVVAGQGTAVVEGTGAATALGRIGGALATIDEGASHLQKETARVVRRLAAIGISLCAAVVVVYGLTRSNWLEGLLAGLTLAIALLPEEAPIILALFLALGAFRIARRQVLARRLPAIESLGSATVLCTDKTGTLTRNTMSIATIDAGTGPFEIGDGALPREAEAIARIGLLASRRDAFDPMERAFVDLGDRLAAPAHDGLRLEREFPLVPERLAVTNVWLEVSGGRLAAAKGAPEAIARLSRLAEAPHAEWLARADAMAARGLRVLAVAEADALPDAPKWVAPEDIPFRWRGLVGLADPIRESVPAAVRTCREAGVRVVMITGDYPVTAREIARKVGLSRPNAVLTGAEVAALDDAALARRIEDADVFARIVPEQKLRIVRAFQARGEVVAMTGDGVNDAPALRAADIGIAMGGRGTDVAREAAQLVLLDDEFASIVSALGLGRRIWDNLKHAMAYVIAIHVPIAGLSLLPVALGWPLLLLPMHVITLELVIDPACSIVFEAEPPQPDIMHRRPRPPGEALFSRRLILFAVLQGLALLAATLGVHAWAMRAGADVDTARALTFATLVLGNVALLWTNRSRSRSLLALLRVPNAALAWVTAFALGAVATALFQPTARHLFRFGAVDAASLGVCVAAAAVCVAWFEILKRTVVPPKLQLGSRRP